jgi:hypothetical protein
MKSSPSVIVCLLVFLLFAHYVRTRISKREINWNGNDWAMGCDFVGNHIKWYHFNQKIPLFVLDGTIHVLTNPGQEVWADSCRKTPKINGTCKQYSGGIRSFSEAEIIDLGMLHLCINPNTNVMPKTFYHHFIIWCYLMVFLFKQQ